MPVQHLSEAGLASGLSTLAETAVVVSTTYCTRFFDNITDPATPSRWCAANVHHGCVHITHSCFLGGSMLYLAQQDEKESHTLVLCTQQLCTGTGMPTRQHVSEAGTS